MLTGDIKKLLSEFTQDRHVIHTIPIVCDDDVTARLVVHEPRREYVAGATRVHPGTVYFEADDVGTSSLFVIKPALIDDVLLGGDEATFHSYLAPPYPDPQALLADFKITGPVVTQKQGLPDDRIPMLANLGHQALDEIGPKLEAPIDIARKYLERYALSEVGVEPTVSLDDTAEQLLNELAKNHIMRWGPHG